MDDFARLIEQKVTSECFFGVASKTRQVMQCFFNWADLSKVL